MTTEFKSELGRKKFWDDRYALELRNFFENGDQGEIWFGKSAENRMLQFVCDNVAKNARILEIGCGNGSLLRRLRENGYTHLTGIDYCHTAVELAKNCSCNERTIDPGTELPAASFVFDLRPVNIQYSEIDFKVVDILADCSELDADFDVILDKGTWDAISLAVNQGGNLAKYRRRVRDCFSQCSTAGYFLLVSCNFTDDELMRQFCVENNLIFHRRLAAAENSFTFAGRIGRTSTGIVFKCLH